MGWFDSEKDEKGRMPETERPAPAAPGSKPAPQRSAARAGEGSTLGERVHVNGTIVCEEGLRILGRIEGKIQAREELNVAKGADVRAVIQGRRVVVEGSVQGDILASEVVVLGPTATLVGNISTPALHIQEGAFFKGKVEMRSAEPAKGSGSSTGRSATKGQVPGKAERDSDGTGDKSSGGESQKGRPGTVARGEAGSGKEGSGDPDKGEAAAAKSGEATGAAAGQRGG